MSLVPLALFGAPTKRQTDGLRNSLNAPPKFARTSLARSDSSLAVRQLPEKIDISAERPQIHAPIRPASYIDSSRPASPAQTPVSTSPIPPLAIPGLPVVL